MPKPKNARERRAEQTLDQLLATRRWCYYIPELDGLVPGRGWRVSIVIEGVNGHYPTGDLDFGTAEHIEPWWWGRPEDPYSVPEQLCAEQNAKLGLDEKAIWEIVNSSMFAKRGRKRG